jgi:uncharacterized protein YebE (UPF0316 family)
VLALVASPDVVLALPIFLAELSVVTLGTLRIISVSKGRRFLAPLLGLFEISLWLYALGQIMQNLGNPACYVAFAAGFVVGNFLGILLEQKLALGTSVVRVITHREAAPLVEDLKSAGFGVTSIGARGATGPVQIVFTVVRRKELEDVRAIIRRFDRQAFYSVDDLQSAAAGVFPVARSRPGPGLVGVLPPLRAGE